VPKAKVNGVSIAYEVHGAGEPLVLAHGYTASKEMWAGQIDAFSPRCRVVVYDVRGHGESETPPGDNPDYPIDTLVDDQRARMDHLGIERAFVGGLSLGGMIAMRFALAHPSMVRALLLCDTSPGMSTAGQWAANRQLMEAIVRSQGVGAVMRSLYTRHASSTGVERRDEAPAGIIDFVQRLEAMSPDGFLGVARAAGEAESVLDRLPEISAPTLIITGDGDFFRGASEEMAKRMHGARFVLISGSFHGTCLWQPEKFAAAVLDFLADVELGRPVAGREER
jgi:pimeloyl-ACP methyl ester carboxylesterase